MLCSLAHHKFFLPTRLEAISTRLEAIASRVEAIAIRLVLQASQQLLPSFECRHGPNGRTSSVKCESEVSLVSSFNPFNSSYQNY